MNNNVQAEFTAPNKETVRQESERRGISLSQVRKERQSRPELQPVPLPHLRVGGKYRDGFGAIIEIVSIDTSGSEYPFVASNGAKYTERGMYSQATHVHLRPLNLLVEVE